MKNESKKMLRSPLTWLGGKSLLRGEILSRLPTAIETWVEVFAGGAWVTFGKSPSPREVLNDIDSHLINFYRVVQDQVLCAELVKELERVLISRELFEDYQKQLKRKKGLSPVKKAAMFYYVLKLSFGGQSKNFGVSLSAKPKLNVKEVQRIFTETQQRLAWVVIEKLDYRKLIPRYDRKYTFFYCDPPYRTPSSRSYFSYLTDKDYLELKRLLAKIEGRFLLSINNDPFFWDLFKDFHIEEIETRYSVMSRGNQKVSELLIRNY